MSSSIKFRWRYTDEWGVQRVTTFELTEASARARWGDGCEAVIEDEPQPESADQSSRRESASRDSRQD